MKNRIKRLLNCLKIEYALFWGICVLTTACYELEVLPQGMLVNNPRTAYMLQTTGVLLAVVMIPMSLRLFSLSLIKNVKRLPLMEALVSYRRWNEVRLAMLLAPAILNLSIYYWTLDNTGLLCAAMVMVASFFCVPGENRLKMELNLDQEEEEARREEK